MPLEDCDRQILESALAAPGAGWGGTEKYPDLPSKAGVLLYALAKSQACKRDGNKRIALLLTEAFVEINGAALAVTRGQLARLIIETAESDPGERERVVGSLGEWFAAYVEYPETAT